MLLVAGHAGCLLYLAVAVASAGEACIHMCGLDQVLKVVGGKLGGGFGKGGRTTSPGFYGKSGKKPKSCNSFVAGTEVVMTDGTTG